MTVDYPDWETSQDHADKIALTGVPLLANPVQVYQVANQVLAAGSTSNVVLNNTGGVFTDLSAALSYEVRMRNLCNVASLAPFVRLRFEWWADNAGTLLLYRDEWQIVCGSTISGPTTYGTGPVRGAFLRILVDNLDGTNAITISDFDIYFSSRPCPFLQPDLRSANTNMAIPGYSTPSEGTSFDGIMGQVHNRLLGISATTNFILGLYNGIADVFVSVTGTAPDVSVTPAYWSPDANALLQLAPGVVLTGAALTAELKVPVARAPLILTYTELSGANTARVGLVAVAEVQQ